MPALNTLLERLSLSNDMPRGQRWLEVMLISLLTVQAARLLWLLLPAMPIGIAPDAAAGTPAAPMPGTDLFYRSDAATDVAAGDDAYILRGIRIGPDGGSAILADAQDRQLTYVAGDQIAPGTVLERVGPGWAMLRSGGRLQRLTLPASSSSPSATSANLPVSMAAGSSNTPIDPASLLADAGLSPNDAGGWTVNPRGTPGPLEAAGLRAGDVVQAVNGQSLTPERVAALGDELVAGAAITLTVRRDGGIRTVTLPAKP